MNHRFGFLPVVLLALAATAGCTTGTGPTAAPSSADSSPTSSESNGPTTGPTTSAPAAPETSPTTGASAEMATGSSVVRVNGYQGFVSPSRNIICDISKTSASCAINDYNWTMPREPAGGCGFAGWAPEIDMSRDAVTLGTCRTDWYAGGPVLPYGHAYAAGSFQCTSQTDGMHCLNRRTGMGFWLSRTHNDIFGYATDPDAGFTFPEGPFTFSNTDGSVICDMDQSAGVDCTLKHFSWNKREDSAKCPNDGERGVQYTVAGGKARTTLCVGMPTDPGTTMDDGTSVILGDYRCDINYDVFCRNERTGHGFTVDEWNSFG